MRGHDPINPRGTKEGNKAKIYQKNKTGFLKEEAKTVKKVNLNEDEEYKLNQIVRIKDRRYKKNKSLYKEDLNRNKSITAILKQ